MRLTAIFRLSRESPAAPELPSRRRGHRPPSDRVSSAVQRRPAGPRTLDLRDITAHLANAIAFVRASRRFLSHLKVARDEESLLRRGLVALDTVYTGLDFASLALLKISRPSVGRLERRTAGARISSDSNASSPGARRGCCLGRASPCRAQHRLRCVQNDFRLGGSTLSQSARETLSGVQDELSVRRSSRPTLGRLIFNRARDAKSSPV